jgi:hypothetical protein
MSRRFGTLLLVASLTLPGSTALASNLPELLINPRNNVPECVTPGRLMAYLKLRNSELDTRYDNIASEYMRQGMQLGLRWDYAFYQMIVETGALSYWRGNRSGDVKASQNNFAGLGATGRGVRGESFKDVSTGVQAHLEHLMLYAGRPVEAPVADRTRKVKEWGVLTSWQQKFDRPINYSDLGAKWAPGTKTYGDMLKAVGDRFHSEVCGRPDPRPELVQEARAGSKAQSPAPPSGANLVQRALEAVKADAPPQRSALGAPPPSQEAVPPSAPFKVLNPPPPDKTEQVIKGDAKAAAATPPATRATAEKASPRTAMLAPSSAKLPVAEAPPALAPNQKCRVWTASYGGQKAIIIRSVADQMVNFTVLDVNEGSEAREADAFISAYARNGKIAGEFSNQSQALEKAFEFCPEG